MKNYTKAIALYSVTKSGDYPLFMNGRNMYRPDSINTETVYPYHIHIVTSEKIEAGDYFMTTFGQNGVQSFYKSEIHLCSDVIDDEVNIGRKILITQNGNLFSDYNSPEFDPKYSKLIMTTDPYLIDDGVEKINDDYFINQFIINNLQVVNVNFGKDKIHLLKPHGYNYGIIVDTRNGQKLKIISKFGTFKNDDIDVPCVDDCDTVIFVPLSYISSVEEFNNGNLKKNIQSEKYRNNLGIRERVEIEKHTPTLNMAKFNELKREVFNPDEFRNFISKYTETDRQRMLDVIYNFQEC